MADYKYAEFLIKYDCKVDSFTGKETIAYRYVNQDINDKNNFLPPALLQPQRLFASKCTSFALSFFENKEYAIKRYRRLVKNSENLSKLLGENLAEGNIKETHGVCSDINNYSHFDLFEYTEAPNFCDSFSIIVSDIKNHEEF